MMKNVLLDIGAHQGVLLLEAQAHLRSTRSRYHMNEASPQSLRGGLRERRDPDPERAQRGRAGARRRHHPRGGPRRRRCDGGDGARHPRQYAARRSGSTRWLRASASRPRTSSYPDACGAAGDRRRPRDATASSPRRSTPSITSSRPRSTTTDRAITNAADEDFDAFTDMFRAWRVSLDATMARKTTWDSFLASHRSLSTAANRAERDRRVQRLRRRAAGRRQRRVRRLRGARRRELGSPRAVTSRRWC